VSIPTFVQLNRAALQLEVDSSAVKGTYEFEILVRDIYGQYEALDVTLIVEDLLTTPQLEGKGQCFSDTGVIAKGFAQDILYLIGTLKHAKFHINVPMTSDE